MIKALFNTNVIGESIGFLDIFIGSKETHTFCKISKPINSCQYLPTLWHHQDLESDRLKMRIPMHLKYYSNENRDST